jgi:hypothetical protein
MPLPFDSLRTLRDGISRRDAFRYGGQLAAGLTIPQLLQSRLASAADGVTAGSELPGFGRAKSVIMLWLLGGISQIESWDPKPDAPEEVRGEFGVIDSVVPGISLGELLPRTSLVTDQLSLVRSMVTDDNGHSSSGYHMLTGVPHIPPGQDNIAAQFPNFAPSQAALVRAVRPDANGLPSAIALPYHMRTDAGTPWPGQGGGDLGRNVDPWLLNCDPSQPGFRIEELQLAESVSSQRLDARRSLLNQLEQHSGDLPSTAAQFAFRSEQAFGLLSAGTSHRAFDLEQESAETRDRYGRYRFGQSALLARRLTEAGVSLVQVNWTRIEGYENEGAWDTHGEHCKSAKGFLMPMFDQTFSALIEDLKVRGTLDETLVVALSEFGRTPRFNRKAGRDHWGHCFSVAMAGGGVRGGHIVGESDEITSAPLSGVVSPADLIATIFHCLGLPADTIVHEQSGRPIPLSRGQVVESLLA